jgi:hypothetical protein
MWRLILVFFGDIEEVQPKPLTEIECVRQAARDYDEKAGVRYAYCVPATTLL